MQAELDRIHPISRQPVSRIPTDPESDSPADGVALCLSGGGYRAMLFHLGAVWRLDELGWLPRLERVSSVSGGSIVAAVLGAAWGSLDFDETGRARRFVPLIVEPVRQLAARTIDVPAILLGLLTGIIGAGGPPRPGSPAPTAGTCSAARHCSPSRTARGSS